MAGAVDLSALKQRVQQRASTEAGAADAGPATAGGIDITEANFEVQVLDRSNEVPVVVVLWSPRSDVCRELVEVFSGLAAADHGTWSLATVNVDEAPRVAQIFGVQAVPTVVALAVGQPIASFQGAQRADQLRRWLDSLLSATAGKLSSPTDSEELLQPDPVLLQARQRLEEGDFAAAQESYQAVLQANPHSVEAQAAIRQIEFLQRATAQDPAAIAAADAAPDDVEAALAAADVQLLNQDVHGAFDRLIALVRRTTGDQRSVVRTRLIELFELFDPAEPDVIVGRRNLANALY